MGGGAPTVASDETCTVEGQQRVRGDVQRRHAERLDHHSGHALPVTMCEYATEYARPKAHNHTDEGWIRIETKDIRADVLIARAHVVGPRWSKTATHVR